MAWRLVAPNTGRALDPDFDLPRHRNAAILLARSVQSWSGALAKPVERRSQRLWVDLVRTCPILDTYFPESRAFELVVNAPMIDRRRNLVSLSRLQENGSVSK